MKRVVAIGSISVARSHINVAIDHLKSRNKYKIKVYGNSYGPLHKPDTFVAQEKLITIATGECYGNDHCEPLHKPYGHERLCNVL